MPPRIVTANSMGLRFKMNKLMAMGPETSVVGHYSGGARAKNMQEGIARAKAFHAQHQKSEAQGGLNAAGIGYHYLITDDGVIICCRSTFHQGAHVFRKNKGRIGVNMPATLTPTIKDKPTRAQAQAFNWLLHNAHTEAMPRAHRTDFNISNVPRFGHKDLMATDCPGLFRGMYLAGGEPFVEPTGDEPAEGFVELTADDETFLVEIEEGRVVPDPEADAAATGPDDDERDAEGAGDEGLELLEPDDEFDEDLSAVLAEIDAEQR